MARSVDLTEAAFDLETIWVRVSDDCPACRKATTKICEDWLEPRIGQPYELTLVCGCGHEWEVAVVFEVVAKIAHATE